MSVLPQRLRCGVLHAPSCRLAAGLVWPLVPVASMRPTRCFSRTTASGVPKAPVPAAASLSRSSRPSPGRRSRLVSLAVAPARPIFSSLSVVTEYVALPPDYTDTQGLPFRRRGDLDVQEVATIFGTGMSVAAANRLLRIMHGRRVAGTLDDPAYHVNTAQYPAIEIERALAYLRSTTPVNELINAGLRAEDELAALERAEAEVRAQAADTAEAVEAAEATETMDKESTPAAAVLPTKGPSTTESRWRARLFREVPNSDVYGVGGLDTIRARNLARHAAREKKRLAAEAARRAAQEKEWAERGIKVMDVVRADGETVRVPAPAPMSPRLQQYALSATSTLEAPPEMSRWQRLWPSYATVAVLLAAGALLGSKSVGGWDGLGVTDRESDGSVVPASTDQVASIFSKVSPASATVLTLIGLNVAVFVLWRVPPLWRLFNRYMIVVPATPRPLSLLGAMFSHQKPGHLMANVLFLYFIGLRLHDEIGRTAFLQVYFTSGLLAFLGSLTNIVLRSNLHLTTLGASGAIYGIAAAYFMLHKFDGFKILGLPPDPYNGIQGLGFIGLMLGMNLLTLRAEKQAIDVVTHFVGMAVGAVFGEAFRRQRQEAIDAAAEGRPPRSLWQATLAAIDAATARSESKSESASASATSSDSSGGGDGDGDTK